eukprot:GHVU01235379.1.p1 GENE.GHVU01235379.1~~GHVU01235379.1.p1  ORF type:complete len:261 (-),score=65.98 GHVU01235379.1:298-1080(-)
MFATRSEYDRGVNTFSPEGRLFQVEYALGAIKLGSTALGLVTDTGVVLASERRVASSLLEPSSIQKILEIDDHIGCAMSGLMADARLLTDHARVEAQNHFFTYNERMPIESCVQSVADLALDFSNIGGSRNRQKAMSRPFGVALLVAGVSQGKAHLYCSDPSGTTTRFQAAAIGSGQEGAETMLQEGYHSNMTFEEAEVLALTVLRQVMEEKLNSSGVEVAAVRTGDAKFKLYSAAEVQAVIERLPAPSVPTAATLVSDL